MHGAKEGVAMERARTSRQAFEWSVNLLTAVTALRSEDIYGRLRASALIGREHLRGHVRQ